MKKNMMTAAAMMMVAFALTACGNENRAASPVQDDLLSVQVVSTETTVTSAATSYIFSTEAVSETATELQTEAVQTVSSAAKRTAAKKTVTETKANDKAVKKTETPAKQEKTVQKTQNAPAEEQHDFSLPAEALKELAKWMIEAYCYVNDSFCYGCSLPVEDEAVTVKIEGCDWDARYHKVTVPNEDEVKDLEDVKWMIGQVLTGSAYDEAVKVATGGEHPIYTEFDGELYILELGKGTLFGDWLWDTLTISNVTDKSFTANIQMRSYGDQIENCSFDFVDAAIGAPNDYRISRFSYSE